jgi:ubiquinone biosynthesis monooxygenase Coq7
MAGAIGDRWSLSFLAETEYQVVEHLYLHLEKLSPYDYKTRTILEKISTEEAHHAATAMAAGGGTQLPLPIKYLMRFAVKIMTTLHSCKLY